VRAKSYSRDLTGTAVTPTSHPHPAAISPALRRLVRLAVSRTKALAGVGVNFLSQGKVAYAGTSLLAGAVFLALMWGLRRGSRAAWVGTLIVSGLIVILGLAIIASEGLIGLTFMGPGLLLLSLVVLPAGARRHFARHDTRVSLS
jgi:lysylphosphatidylglycerol synthetase-like protein (DUF2156 family)